MPGQLFTNGVGWQRLRQQRPIPEIRYKQVILSNLYTLDWLDSMAGLSQSSDMPLSKAEHSPEIRLASVLVPVFWHQKDWHLLFIRRVVNTRDRHSGQVAFPGGRRDAEDKDSVATALREAREEIGLSSIEVEVLLQLDDYRTSSHYLVSPVVARVPWPYPYRAQPSEVDRIFSIPMSWLTDPANVDVRYRLINRGEEQVQTPVVYFEPYDGETLWGASARMTIAFLRALHKGELVLR